MFVKINSVSNNLQLVLGRAVLDVRKYVLRFLVCKIFAIATKRSLSFKLVYIRKYLKSTLNLSVIYTILG